MKGTIFVFTRNLTKNCYPVLKRLLYKWVNELSYIYFLLLMTLEKARKLLGKEAELYSDEQVMAIMEKARNLSLACVRKIDTNMSNFGMTFFNEKKYVEEEQICQGQ